MKSFIMLGQSNMAGRGNLDEVPKIENPLCHMLKNGRFVRMEEPVNSDRAYSGVSLAASFADEYAKYFNENVGLIPCADGGTSLCEWLPGGNFFDHAVAQAKLAQRSSEIIGILWHQGENDSMSTDEAALYYNRFINIISTLKKELSLSDNTPLIIGELGEFVEFFENGRSVAFKDINATLKQLSEKLPSSAFVSAKGLTCKDDGIHFDLKSCREFGKRYFNEYLKILNEQHFVKAKKM